MVPNSRSAAEDSAEDSACAPAEGFHTVVEDTGCLAEEPFFLAADLKALAG